MAKFQLDKLHFFKYDAKWKERLAWWDKQPLMFPLHIGPSHTLGVNIHWIPWKLRKPFVEYLLQLSQTVRSPKRFAQLTYLMMKGDSRLTNSLKGIRMYINTRASRVKIISKDDAAEFFLPLTMNSSLFRKHRARKVQYDS